MTDVNAKWKEHWVDMPEYVQEDNHRFVQYICIFVQKNIIKTLLNVLVKNLQKKQMLSGPKLDITKNRYLRWVDDGFTFPLRHPMYIVSKGRADSMITSRSLSRMKIPHYIVVEPQDMQDYDKALDTFDIREYVTLLEAPFSNHGDGF